MFNRIIQQLFKYRYLIKALLIMGILITMRSGVEELWEWWGE